MPLAFGLGDLMGIAEPIKRLTHLGFARTEKCRLGQVFLDLVTIRFSRRKRQGAVASDP